MGSHKTCDIVIAGAGIVGLTVSLEMRRRLPSAGVAVFEKETELGRHASGRNSVSSAV